MSRFVPVCIVATLLVGLGCGGPAADDDDGSGGVRPTIVVSTDLLGDVVELLVGDEAEVLVAMPGGADPHTFEPSAGLLNEMLDADAVVINGADLEVGLAETLALAEDEGVPILHAIDHVTTLAADDDHTHGPDEHEDGTDAATDPAHSHGDVDPHFFTDPARMVDAAEGLLEALAEEVPSLSSEAARSAAEPGLVELGEAAADVEATLAAVPPEDRVLVTGHDALRYLADTHGYEVVAVDALDGHGGGDGVLTEADTDDLSRAIDDARVPAIFVDASTPDRVVESITAAVGDVEVVVLHAESLGEEGSGAGTYTAMVRRTAEAIAAALG